MVGTPSSAAVWPC